MKRICKNKVGFTLIEIILVIAIIIILVSVIGLDAAGLLDSGDRARSSVSQQVTSMESGIQSREDKLSGYGF
jgi:type II secretory pathway pseudopilin PulG